MLIAICNWGGCNSLATYKGAFSSKVVVVGISIVVVVGVLLVVTMGTLNVSNL